MADLYIIGEKLKLREYIDKIREEYKYATMSWLEGVDAIYVPGIYFIDKMYRILEKPYMYVGETDAGTPIIQVLDFKKVHRLYTRKYSLYLIKK